LPSFVTANALPVSVLLQSHLAVELRPELTLRFDSPHGAGPDALISLSLAIAAR
jgi:hypothetical protein